MKKVDNLFPVLFAAAGILFVVWGISSGEAASEAATSDKDSGASEARSAPAINLPDESRR